jgi:hypothetical protein
MSSDIESLYHKGMPKLLDKLLRPSTAQLHHPVTRKEQVAPHSAQDSLSSSSLDDRINAAKRQIQQVLGSVATPATRSNVVVLQKRAMYIPVEAIAIKLNRLFWFRLYKRSANSGRPMKKK